MNSRNILEILAMEHASLKRALGAHLSRVGPLNRVCHPGPVDGRGQAVRNLRPRSVPPITSKAQQSEPRSAIHQSQITPISSTYMDQEDTTKH